MQIFNGKRAAAKILKEVAANIKKEKLKPALAVILVGDDEASKLYIGLKKKAAKKVGIEVFEFKFDRQAKQEEITGKIKELNDDKNIHGIIVQLPLPAIFHAAEMIEAIEQKKDVDGFCKENFRRLEKNEECLAPVLPSAISLVLNNAFKKGIKERKIMALVNSDFFGRSLRVVLEKEGAKVDYMVRNVCVIKGAEKSVASAEVLISVCGCPKFIKGDMIKESAVLIDAGITRFSDGRVIGDIDKDSVAQKASYLTPVPGGIGPITVALLLKNVYLAARGKKVK